MYNGRRPVSYVLKWSGTSSLYKTQMRQASLTFMCKLPSWMTCYILCKRKTLSQRWFDVGPTSETMGQHQTNIRSTFRGLWWAFAHIFHQPRRWSNASLMLVHCPRRLTSIKSTLVYTIDIMLVRCPRLWHKWNYLGWTRRDAWDIELHRASREFDLLLLTRMSCQRKSTRDLTMMAQIQRVFQDNL